MLVLPKVQSLLEDAARGRVNLSPDAFEEYLQSIQETSKKQFSRKSGGKIRMSGLGRPICQQQLSMQGFEEEMEYNSFNRFILGDLIEALAILTMRLADVDIIETQKPVELDLGEGITINGTLDLIMDDGTGPKVWDIKSASDYSFNHKFGAYGGYEKIKEDDVFGYIMQGYLYSAAVNLPFGGWVVINKNNGEWTICTAPDDQEDEMKEYLDDALSRAKFLLKNKKFQKGFKPQLEIYKGKPTGNKLMPKECSFCGYKKHCWPKAVYLPKATSSAQSRPATWYTTHKTDSVVL